MFEFLFKYPAIVFSKGKLVLLSGWPEWLLILLTVAAIVALSLLMWRSKPAWNNLRSVILTALQAAVV